MSLCAKTIIDSHAFIVYSMFSVCKNRILQMWQVFTQVSSVVNFDFGFSLIILVVKQGRSPIPADILVDNP